MSDVGSASEAETTKCPVIRAWMDMPTVSTRAAGGKIAEVGKDGLTRESVAANADILEPLIKELGTRPSINQVMDVVARFLFLCRPRGKKLPSSAAIKMEAWILRRLVSLFGQVTRRPHVPRDPQLRQLFKIVGIDFDEPEAGTHDADADADGEHDDYESWDSEPGTDDEVVEPTLAEETHAEPPRDEHRVEAPPSSASDGGGSTRSSLGTTLVLTPEPRKRSASVPSAPKLCAPMKCGWLCATCKLTGDTKEYMLSKKCPRAEGHVLVESPAVCKMCYQLGYDMASFKKGPCPEALTFDDEPGKSKEVPPEVSETKPKPSEEKPDKRWVTSVDFERKQRVEAEMQAAAREIKRLELMKKIQLERQQLADLVAQKAKNTSPEMLDTFPMSEPESSHLAAIEAMKTSPPSLADETPKPLARAGNMDNEPDSSATKDAHDEPGEPKHEQNEQKAASHSTTAETDHAKALPVETPTGMSNKTMTKALQTMKTTPCLSPEEQCRALGKTPKPKGRPSKKNTTAKAASKPKVAAQSKPKAKAKAKAKARNRKRKASKAPETDDNAEWHEGGHAMEKDEKETWDWETDEAGYGYEQYDYEQYDYEQYDYEQDDTDQACKKESSKTRKPRGEGKGKTYKGKHPASSSSSSRKPKASKTPKEAKSSTSKAKDTKASKAARKTKTKDTKASQDNDPATLERKARLSRKSCASKKARREALQAGKTPEDAKAAAAKAYAECD